MRTPAAGELLALCERWEGAHPAQRALALVGAAWDGVPDDEPAAWPAGRRDAELLGLRERLFGPRVVSTADCPACGERVELDFAVAAVRVEGEPPPEPLALEAEGWALVARLPTAGDLAAAATASGVEEARQVLLERCVVEAHEHGEPRGADELPEEVVRALGAGLAAADPQAEVRLALVCPACGHGWEALFDIASFLWSEVEAWSERTLREVHVLALAYGWREADVLALSPWRRRRYLEMAGA
ncbi:MAG TPA: hypothetical protein VFX98_09725 [Longimicrobiaceae bacterium]|nr:hypothetical protein [Longimicrobiaceae bacterium]